MYWLATLISNLGALFQHCTKIKHQFISTDNSAEQCKIIMNFNRVLNNWHALCTCIHFLYLISYMPYLHHLGRYAIQCPKILNLTPPEDAHEDEMMPQKSTKCIILDTVQTVCLGWKSDIHACIKRQAIILIQVQTQCKLCSGMEM